MTARLINGKACAIALKESLGQAISVFKKETSQLPKLAIIQIGDNPASTIYIKTKVKQMEELGMKAEPYQFSATTSLQAVSNVLEKLNHDPSVHGILVQLPIEAQFSSLLNQINPEKDVDCLTCVSVGKFYLGYNSFIPATPLGCLILLKHQFPTLEGKYAVIVGRSQIVGRPLAELLLKENCTVTIAHSKTLNLPELCRQADILIVAVGQAQLVKAEWVKPGAYVIDVGITRRLLKEKQTEIVGDVDFEAVSQKAGFITPVPGGVGPMTVACLLANVFKAACNQADFKTNFDPLKALASCDF